MSFGSDWLSRSKQTKQADLLTLVNGSWPPKIDYINLVKTPGHWGVCASIGPNFNNAVFGRDSITTADDLLYTHQELVHDIIVTLTKLQGHKVDIQTEEEPGKIHHEYRAEHLIDDTTAIPLSSLQRLVDLEHDWGINNHDYLIYYGSHDSTPLFVRLLGRYIQQYGKDILYEKYLNRDNNTYSIQASAQAALAWIVTKIESSKSGLLEYKRLNKNAILNQSWKDSATAYLHTDGSLANGDGGIVSVELQGYVYDSLVAGIKYIADNDHQTNYWQHLASQIQERTVDKLWMDSLSFFAQGLDYDDQGNSRHIDTVTSNGAALLESQLLKELPEQQREPIIKGIVQMIYSNEFITDAGVRSRALRHQSILPIIDYHGTYTVWPKETHTIAKGLHLHGYSKLAEQLENRLLRSIVLAGEFYELFYVEPDGTVWYDREAGLQHFATRAPGGNLPAPEPGQAWTISAVLQTLYGLSQATDNSQNKLTSQFEQSLLNTLPTVSTQSTSMNINDASFTMHS